MPFDCGDLTGVVLGSISISFISFFGIGSNIARTIIAWPFNGMWQSVDKAKTIFHRNNRHILNVLALDALCCCDMP